MSQVCLRYGSFMFRLLSHLKYLGLCTEFLSFLFDNKLCRKTWSRKFHVVVLKGVFLSLFTFLNTEQTATRNRIKNDMLCLQKDYWKKECFPWINWEKANLKPVSLLLWISFPCKYMYVYMYTKFHLDSSFPLAIVSEQCLLVWSCFHHSEHNSNEF